MASPLTGLAIVALAISELMLAGSTIAEIMEATKDTGKVPQEMWDAQMDEMNDYRRKLGLTT